VTLDRYVATEIALDCSEGLLSRREALRRLGLMGLSAATATALLAACGGGTGKQAAPTTTLASKETPGLLAVGQEVSFAGPKGRLIGSWAPADAPRGGVLVVHENRGLTPHIQSIPPRLSGEGYAALAVDLLSEEGGTAAVGDEGAAQAALAKAPEARLVADLHASVDELGRRVPGRKLGVIGFCFGGGLVWRLLADGEPRLAAAAPFYGPAPDNPDFSRSKAAVLAVYAEKDTRVNGTRDGAAAALQRAGLPHEVKTFPGVDHAFFNDTGPRYDAAAARQAFADVLAWFGKYLA
jgi:carboxymethylenebutenolidase